MSESTIPIDWAALSDDELISKAHREIWLSGFAGGPCGYHAFVNALAAFDEAEARGKPHLYRLAWERAERGAQQ